MKIPPITPPATRPAQASDLPEKKHASGPAPISKSLTAPAAEQPLLPLHIKAEALLLSRSMMQITLPYRLECKNLGGTALAAVSINADLISAYSGMPVDEQIAHAGTQLPFIRTIAAIVKGGSDTFEGELRLPVQDLHPIPQGQVRLYLPLLRLRIQTEGFSPIIRTFVVGTIPYDRNAKLQPFRLDEIAQTYHNVGLRALD